MFPVSGAEQFSASGPSSGLRPVISASGAYSRLVRPAPHSSPGMKRFHSPCDPRLRLQLLHDRGMELGIARLLHLPVVDLLGRIHVLVHEGEQPASQVLAAIAENEIHRNSRQVGSVAPNLRGLRRRSRHDGSDMHEFLIDSARDGKVLQASDQFLNPAERLLDPADPVSDPDPLRVPRQRGWTGGRPAGSGRPAMSGSSSISDVAGRSGTLVVDTTHITTSLPAACSVEAIDLPGDPSLVDLVRNRSLWHEVVPRSEPARAAVATASR